MKRWIVAYNGKKWEPNIFSASVKQNTPTIIFTLNNKRFSIEFENQTDYVASAHGKEANVMMISNDRSKRFHAIAVFK